MLRGKSGVVHSFSEVIIGPNIKKVVDVRNDKASELDIIRFYTKIIDVETQSAEFVAPSFTEGASQLAKTYGIRLRVTEG